MRTEADKAIAKARRFVAAAKNYETEASCRCRRFWHATHDCVAPYVDIVLHRGQF